MSELDRYLRRATRGLWGRKKREMWSELEEHALERAHALQVFGLREEDALSRALRDLGPAEAVAGALNGVHTMPSILKTSALAALLTVLGLSVVTGSSAQVSITYDGPRKACSACAPRPSGDKSVAWLNNRDLGRQLTAQGIRTRWQGNTLVVFLPRPDGKGDSLINFDPSLSLGGQPYNTVHYLVFALAGVPGARVQGYDNPTFTVNGARFTLGTRARPLVGNTVYEPLAGEIADELYRRATARKPYAIGLAGRGHLGEGGRTGLNARVASTPLAEGDIAMIVYRTPNGNPYFDVGPVSAKGAFTYHVGKGTPDLRFVSDPKQLSPYPSGGKVNALLVRLTGTLPSSEQRYEIVRP